MKIYFTSLVLSVSMLSISGCWKKNSAGSDDDPPASDPDTASSSERDATDLVESDPLDTGNDSATVTATDSGSDVTEGECIEDWRILYRTDVSLSRVDVLDTGDIIAGSCLNIMMMDGTGERRPYGKPDEDRGDCALAATAFRDQYFYGNRYGQVFRFADDEWRMLRNGHRSLSFPSRPNSLGRFGTELFAAGEWLEADTKSALMHWDGQAWRPVTNIPSAAPYQRLYPLQNGSLLAVPDEGGQMAVFSGSEWTPVNRALTEEIADVWGMSEADFWVVTEENIYHITEGPESPVIEPQQIDPMILATDGAKVTLRYTHLFGYSEDDMVLVGIMKTSYDYDANRSATDEEMLDIDPDIESLVLIRFDGVAFAKLGEASYFGKDIEDIWGINDKTLFISGEALYFDGSDFGMPDPYLDGRIIGDGPDDIHAAAAAGCRGAHFNGEAWACLDMPLPIADILPSPDGAVYGLGSGGVFRWTESGVTTIRDPWCTELRDIVVDPQGRPMVLCKEGHVMRMEEDEWHSLPPLIGRGWYNMCLMGETLLGVAETVDGSDLVRYENDAATVVAAIDADFVEIACGSRGALLRSSEMFHYDGDDLVPLPPFPIAPFRVTAMGLFGDDEVYIAGVEARDTGEEIPLLLSLEAGEWRIAPMPLPVQDLAAAPDGRLVGVTGQGGIVMAYGC